MRKKTFGIIAVLALIMLALAAVPALAAAHFKQGGGPFDQDLGTRLNVTGTLVGLGNEGGDIQLVAQGRVIVACVNPSGQNEPPGQQPAPTTLTSPVTPINPEDVTRSGQYTFNLTTAAPTTPTGVCKSSKGWSTRVTDVVFTSYTIIVTDGQTGATTTLGPFPFTAP